MRRRESVRVRLVADVVERSHATENVRYSTRPVADISNLMPILDARAVVVTPACSNILGCNGFTCFRLPLGPPLDGGDIAFRLLPASRRNTIASNKRLNSFECR